MDDEQENRAGTPLGDETARDAGYQGWGDRKMEDNASYGQGNVVVEGNWRSAYPQETLPPLNPAERLREEVDSARNLYRHMSSGEHVDYARLAGMLAGCLDNIAFYVTWIDTRHTGARDL